MNKHAKKGKIKPLPEFDKTKLLNKEERKFGKDIRNIERPGKSNIEHKKSIRRK